MQAKQNIETTPTVNISPRSVRVGVTQALNATAASYADFIGAAPDSVPGVASAVGSGMTGVVSDAVGLAVEAGRVARVRTTRASTREAWETP